MIDALCAAVVSQLNGETWSPAFTAVFNDRPEFEPEDVATLTVTVLPNEVARIQANREQDQITYIIDVAFQQRAALRPSTGTDPIDAMAVSLRNLQQTVGKWLMMGDHRSHRTPPAYQAARLLSVEHVPIYDAQTLRNERRLIGVMRLTYEEHETA